MSILHLICWKYVIILLVTKNLSFFILHSISSRLMIFVTSACIFIKCKEDEYVDMRPQSLSNSIKSLTDSSLVKKISSIFHWISGMLYPTSWRQRIFVNSEGKIVKKAVVGKDLVSLHSYLGAEASYKCQPTQRTPQILFCSDCVTLLVKSLQVNSISDFDYTCSC